MKHTVYMLPDKIMALTPKLSRNSVFSVNNKIDIFLRRPI